MGKALAHIAYWWPSSLAASRSMDILVEWGYVPKPQGPYTLQTQAERPQPTTPPPVVEVPASPRPVLTATTTAPRQAQPPVQIPKARAPQPSSKAAAATSLRSIRWSNPIKVEFVNESGRPVKVFWVNYQGKEECYYGLAPGQSYTQRTFATHPWRVRDMFDGKVLAEIVAGESFRRVNIRSRSLELPVIWPIGMPVTCGQSRS